MTDDRTLIERLEFPTQPDIAETHIYGGAIDLMAEAAARIRQLEGNGAVWLSKCEQWFAKEAELEAQLEAANLRHAAALEAVARARDDALSEAVNACEKVKAEAKSYQLPQLALGASKCIEDLGDLRTKPAETAGTVTVQQAANLVLEGGYDPKIVIEAMRDAKDFGCGSCDIFDTALRTIAGEKT